MNRLNGKIAMITGGANGIGAACARQFLSESATVVVCDLTAAGVAPDYAGYSYLPLDVTSEAAWKDAVATAEQRVGPIDILVNAAGIVGNVVDGALDKMTLDDWRRVMAVNLDGTFLGCRELMSRMQQRGGGSIINLSSAGSYYPTQQNAAYGASKGAVTQFTKTVALFGSQNGNRIRCNSVHPGQIDTGMLQSIRDQKKMRAEVSAYTTADSASRVPLGIGCPQDVANLVTFLASDEASYITGAEFSVDGGWRLIR